MGFNVKIRQNTGEYLRPIEHCFFYTLNSPSDYFSSAIIPISNYVEQLSSSNFSFDFSIFNNRDNFTNDWDFGRSQLNLTMIRTLNSLYYNTIAGAATLKTVYLIYSPFAYNGNVLLRAYKNAVKSTNILGDSYFDIHYRFSGDDLGIYSPFYYKITNGTGYATVYTFSDFSRLYDNGYCVYNYVFKVTIPKPAAGTAYAKIQATYAYGTSTVTASGFGGLYIDTSTNSLVFGTAPTTGITVGGQMGTWSGSIASTSTATGVTLTGFISINDPEVKLQSIELQGYIGGTTTTTSVNLEYKCGQIFAFKSDSILTEVL